MCGLQNPKVALFPTCYFYYQLALILIQYWTSFNELLAQALAVVHGSLEVVNEEVVTDNIDSGLVETFRTSLVNAINLKRK